ncbi:glycosyltransferase [Empedobacter tilapiae]|uniref:glycosyltransferase n=1 Tax=Empedobacter tilapiae TaxID=2491114 RepID=UPI0028D24E0C|nr:glycosyltransferase [Empedobacter tilapiae]
MNVGVVSTWFERGAAYVSKIFEEVLSSDEDIDVFIYARGGEEYAKGNDKWDRENVHWGKMMISPFSSTVIHRSDFTKWIKENKIELIIFNEQHWFQPLLWCKEMGVKTVAYIDYYTEETIPLYNIYDCVICNTKRHYSAFQKHHNAVFLPWGTQVDLFKKTNSSLVNKNYVTFFHSCGWDTYRKGTDLLLQAFEKTKKQSKLIIHTQNEITKPELAEIIDKLRAKNKIEIVVKTVHAPGLFHLGDVYVYPSRLEGIGLTIVEAISSGLGVVVPDNPPMNEFAYPSNSKLINIDRLYSRSDGYYWPKCEIDIQHLADILDDLAENKEQVMLMKEESRKIAEEKLDVNKNFSSLHTIIKNVGFVSATNQTVNLINGYDNKGFKRFHKFYLAFYPVFNTIRNFSKK